MDSDSIISFSKLPRELRDKIYEHFESGCDEFASTANTDIYTSWLRGIVPLFAINRQIRSEAINTILAKKSLYLWIDELGPLFGKLGTDVLMSFQKWEVGGFYLHPGSTIEFGYSLPAGRNGTGPPRIHVEGCFLVDVNKLTDFCNTYKTIKEICIYVRPTTHDSTLKLVHRLENLKGLRSLKLDLVYFSNYKLDMIRERHLGLGSTGNEKELYQSRCKELEAYLQKRVLAA